MFNLNATELLENATQQNLCEALIVIPCYNEEKRLDISVFRQFVKQNSNIQFLFVNDGSTDNTAQMLAQFAEEMPTQAHFLDLEKNGGKAEAVRQGMKFAAKTDALYVGYWDADLATPLSAIHDFLRVARRDRSLDLVFGSRHQLIGHKVKRDLSRRIVSRICNMLARIAIRMPVRDTQCGAKLFRNTSAFATALDNPFLAGWLFDVELFERLARATKGQNFYELPLYEWQEVDGSKIGGSDIVKSGIAMLRLIAQQRLGISL